MEHQIYVVDDFLDYKDFKSLRDLLFGYDFAWHLNGVISPEYESGCKFADKQFTHGFYKHEEVSKYFSYVKPLFNKLKLDTLIRCKANLNPYYKRVVEGGYHIDCEYGWTAVYYVNTNNGYTKFKRGKKITSKENRCVIFPSMVEHTGTTTSNEPFRCVINTNFSLPESSL